MDNASSHRKEEVQEYIKNKKNDFVYVLPYHHFQNPIEKMFNQLKYYMRKDEPMSFNLIKESIIKSLKYISVKNFQNYFKSSLEITKKEVEEIKMRYKKKEKIYKE
jgi:hypothetical protein